MHEGLDDDAQPGEAPRELDHLKQAEGAEHCHVGLPDVDEQGGGDDHDHVEDVPGLEEIELRGCLRWKAERVRVMVRVGVRVRWRVRVRHHV